MNYLAHAWLSFELPEITVGNLMSDFVKGKQKEAFPEKIGQGIMLHRAIDGFTDTHPATRRAKTYFREAYGLYSGAITDIVYDHFLANDVLIFPPDESGSALKAFAQRTYERVGEWQDILPERFARLFRYMRAQDWLANYGHKELIYNSFEGLARRASYMPPPGQAITLFETHYAALEACYVDFFPEVKDFALRTLNQLQQDDK